MFIYFTARTYLMDHLQERYGLDRGQCGTVPTLPPLAAPTAYPAPASGECSTWRDSATPSANPILAVPACLSTHAQ